MIRFRQRFSEARAALGGRALWRAKRARAVRMLWSYTDRAERTRRMRRLQQQAGLRRLPNDWQLFVGSLAMLSRFVYPASRKYYQQTGKNFIWHQLLRLLDEPSAVMDAVGLSAPKDVIVGHLIQVAHHEVGWDVQLLHMFPDGVQCLKSELRQLIAGTHPRQAAIAAIVEVADYHERLLACLESDHDDDVLRIYDVPPGTESLFAPEYSLPTRFLSYCSDLPASPIAAAADMLPWRSRIPGRRGGQPRRRSS